MKQVEVQIMGQGYLLSCPEDGEAMMQQAVERVDAAMCKIRDAGKVKARDRIAVLASLNLAFELCEALAPSNKAHSTPDTLHRSASLPTRIDDSEQIRDLLHRLDQALDADGRLI
jgi:cell division protein ZapA